MKKIAKSWKLLWDLKLRFKKIIIHKNDWPQCETHLAYSHISKQVIILEPGLEILSFKYQVCI